MTQAWMDQFGALVGTRDGDPAVVAPTFGLALTDLGFRRREGNDKTASVNLQHFVADRGAWALGTLDRGTARGLAARLAARLGTTVWLVAARATYRENVKPACLFDASEATVSADGVFGTARPSVLDGIAFSESELDTDHPWRLVEQTLDHGLSLWVGRHAQTPRTEWMAPAALPNARLEGIARQIRAGAKVEAVMVTNRPALRVKAIDGTVSTAFLSDDEIDALAVALPAIPLPTRAR